MTSPRFWLLFCLLIVLVIALFGGPVFARGHKEKRSTRPITIKIGQPYRVERLRPVSATDANALYLYWRDSVQFKALGKISLKHLAKNEHNPGNKCGGRVRPASL